MAPIPYPYVVAATVEFNALEGKWFRLQRVITFELRLTRQAADAADQDFVQLQADVNANTSSPRSGAPSVAPKVRLRWYDAPVDGVNRRDIRSSLLAKLVWTPEWLTKVIPKGEIDFQLYFLRNYSTIKQHEFVAWELGPQVIVAWKL